MELARAGAQDPSQLEHRLQVILKASAGFGNVLLQAWLPALVDQDNGTHVCLKTQGCPFALQGSGESLSLYRFQSCKYRFLLTPGARERDATSEAFLTQKALLIADWQRDTQSWSAHPRAADARADQLQSSIMLPVFEAGAAYSNPVRPVAVVEATSAADAACPVSIETVAEELCLRLEDAALSVVPPPGPPSYASRPEPLDVGGDPSGRSITRAQIPAHSPGSHSSSQGDPDEECLVAQVQQAGASMQTQSEGGTGDTRTNCEPGEGTCHTEGGQGLSALPGSSTAPSKAAQLDAAGNGAEQEEQEPGVRTRRSRKGTKAQGTSAAYSKDITVEEVKKHYCYGLKEAAMRLGVCTTTLKRICRRNGISRWPRRELARDQEGKEATAMEVDAASEEAAPNAVGRSPSNTAPASDAQVPSLHDLEQPQPEPSLPSNLPASESSPAGQPSKAILKPHDQVQTGRRASLPPISPMMQNTAAGSHHDACELLEPPGLWAPPSGFFSRHLSAPDLSPSAMAGIDIPRPSSVGPAVSAAESAPSVVWEAALPPHSAAHPQRAPNASSNGLHDDDAMAAWLSDDGLLLDLPPGGGGSLEALQAQQVQHARQHFRPGQQMLLPPSVHSSPSANSAQHYAQIAQLQNQTQLAQLTRQHMGGPPFPPAFDPPAARDADFSVKEARLMNLLSEANQMMQELQGYTGTLQSQRTAALGLRSDPSYHSTLSPSRLRSFHSR